MIKRKKNRHFSKSIFVFALIAVCIVYRNLSFFRESHRPNKAVRGGSCAHSKAEPLVLHIDAYGWKRAREAYGCKFTRDRQCLSQASAVILNLEKYPATSTPSFSLFDFTPHGERVINYWRNLRLHAGDQALFFGWSSEVAVSDNRPINNKQIMNLMNYSIHIGPDADYPYLLVTPPRLYKPLATLLQKKTNHILFLSSNCDTADGRDSFVQRFMEFVDVDSIGSCLHNKDYPSDIRGFELNPATGQSYRDSWHGNYVASNLKLLERYKFRLVMPNSICTDYVTEKLIDSFGAATIPIYFGATNSHDFDMGIIAGVHPAMIHVIDFDSLSALARHVEEVSTNTTLYSLYFEYIEHREKWEHLYPRHIKAIRKKRLNSVDEEEFVCKVVHMHHTGKEKVVKSKIAQPPNQCYGRWDKYLKAIGKNLSMW